MDQGDPDPYTIRQEDTNANRNNTFWLHDEEMNLASQNHWFLDVYAALSFHLLPASLTA